MTGERPRVSFAFRELEPVATNLGPSGAEAIPSDLPQTQNPQRYLRRRPRVLPHIHPLLNFCSRYTHQAALQLNAPSVRTQHPELWRRPETHQGHAGMGGRELSRSLRSPCPGGRLRTHWRTGKPRVECRRIGRPRAPNPVGKGPTVSGPMEWASAAGAPRPSTWVGARGTGSKGSRGWCPGD